MFYYDWTIIVLLPAVILAGIAQGKVKSAYRRYSSVAVRNGMTGVYAARKILDAHGLFDVPIEMVSGEFTDHYDPMRRVMRLSSGVYNDASIASVAIAAHECGHALQHQKGYVLLTLRNIIAKPVSLVSMASWPLLIIGIIMTEMGKLATGNLLMHIGVIAFGAALLFHLITLPVELDASRRALKELQMEGIVGPDEITPAKKVLSAAALTYVAALITALAQLIRILLLVRE